ncbi:trypsin-like peptidase domain-containing protein [Solihabitans fulvus]|uniref:Trypsin-like peptidase domain-containing protein n=1 Tax=Solihabitans fulvus TaxID=1892852 RepID=A0A5B2X5Z1_9PSEU|nr:serine protease [Solihabitans fulvus]KAA2258640.1 trypsin-like peptidase domain-containing protein [Solihabitans fulvus]
MVRRLLGVFAAAIVGALALSSGVATAAPTQTPAAPSVTVDFTGIVALSNCSGSVVRMANSGPNDPAFVLSNGHCLESGFLSPGQVIVNQASRRTFDLLDPTGQYSLGTLRATKIAYATMTNTDVSLYQLSSTYAQIQQRYGIKALEISSAHPTQGADIRVVSGYWQTIYSCNLDGFAYRLHEGDWVWQDSLRYTSSCDVIGGTSGSPVIDTASGKIVGVNNTINESGESCTLNNPCEVDQAGNVTVRQGIGYAEETYLFNSCVAAGNKITLTLPGCTLPRP